MGNHEYRAGAGAGAEKGQREPAEPVIPPVDIPTEPQSVSLSNPLMVSLRDEQRRDKKHAALNRGKQLEVGIDM